MLFPEEPLIDDEVPQRQVKAELIIAANAGMKLDAVGVGDQDLRLGVEWLKTATDGKLPMMSANLVDSKGKTVFPAHVVKTLCNTKVGIFSVMTALDDSGKPLLDGNPSYRVEDPFETAKKEVAALKAEGAEVIFALTHLGLQDDLRLAREVPGIRFIFGAHSMSQLAEPQREKETGTWIFQAGYRTKHLGRVDVDFKGPVATVMADLSDVSNADRVRDRVRTYEERIAELTARLGTETDPDRKLMVQDQIAFYAEQLEVEKKDLPKPNSGATLVNTLVELSREVPDDEKVAPMVEAALVKITALPPVAQISGDALGKGPVSGPYIGAQVCQGCHQQQYTDWTQTPHAKAYKTLVSENHHMDFDCVGCHTTGYKKEGGPKDPFTVGGLAAVQCETCHGPGREHALEPKKVDMNIAFDEATCKTCHSDEQTGDRFVMADYLPKVDHKSDLKPGQKADAGHEKTRKKTK